MDPHNDCWVTQDWIRAYSRLYSYINRNYVTITWDSDNLDPDLDYIDSRYI